MTPRILQFLEAVFAASLCLLPLKADAAQPRRSAWALARLPTLIPPFWMAHEFEISRKLWPQSEIVYVRGSRPILAMLGGSIDVSQVGGAAAGAEYALNLRARPCAA